MTTLQSEKPTKVRWMVFGSLLALCTVNYIDRAVISICMPSIEADLHFGPALVGVILSALFLGLYADADSFRLDCGPSGAGQDYSGIRDFVGYISGYYRLFEQ